MRIRIATWNVRRRRLAWDFLDDRLTPDIALLQETVPPPGRPHVVYGDGGISRNRPWGSAVAARHPITEVRQAKSRYMRQPAGLHRTHPGCVAIAEVAVRGVPITAVSVYGLIEDGYANTTMHRLLSDLTPLFDSRRERLVLGGDLNISTQLGPPYDRHSRNVFDRLEIFGLVDLLTETADRRPRLTNCWCRDEPCTHVQTHQHPRSAKPWHNDYLFATRDLACGLVDCYALDGDGDGAWSISDHCPVVAELSLPGSSVAEAER